MDLLKTASMNETLLHPLDESPFVMRGLRWIHLLFIASFLFSFNFISIPTKKVRIIHIPFSWGDNIQFLLLLLWWSPNELHIVKLLSFLGNHESSTRISHRASYHVRLCVFSIYTLLWFMDGQHDIYLCYLLFIHEKSDSFISIPHMGCKLFSSFFFSNKLTVT